MSCYIMLQKNLKIIRGIVLYTYIYSILFVEIKKEAEESGNSSTAAENVVEKR